jgi:hypothetical protein
MKIHDDHMYHGAALTQIAEHPRFTAINAFHHGGQSSRSGFLVNHDIGIYLKYATKKTKRFGEFFFTFNADHIAEIDALSQKADKVFIVFVCVQAEEICCIRRAELHSLIDLRERELGHDEDIHTVLVTVPTGKSCRVYMNAPGERKKSLGEIIVPRNRFPNAIFE